MTDDVIRITDIAKVKRKRDLLLVTFSDEATCEIDAETLLISRWVVGTTVGFDERQQTVAQSRLKQAKHYTMDLLGRRIMSETEVRRKLQTRKYSPMVIDACIDDLLRIGLLDDQDFAERYCRDQVQRNQVGPYKLRQDLRQRGISDDLAASVIEQLSLETDPVEQAITLLRRRGFGLELRDDNKRKQRAYALLIRRGFDNETVQDALARVSTDTEL
jgi:regulatory protein